MEVKLKKTLLFVYPSSCPPGDNPSTAGRWWPPTNDFSSRTEESDRLALRELIKNKQPWQPLMLSALCAHVWVLTASPQKPGGRRWWRERQRARAARKPLANGFPTGPSLPETRSKTRGATAEQPLANLDPYPLTRIWSRGRFFSTSVK